MTSATEHLRALLDERGVEYRWDNGTATWYVDGVMYNAWGFDNERLIMSVCHLAPEQAIAATLGPGTCHIDLVGYNEREDRFQCNSCDWSMWFRRGTLPCFNYCPNCGKRVVG